MTKKERNMITLTDAELNLLLQTLTDQDAVLMDACYDAAAEHRRELSLRAAKIRSLDARIRRQTVNAI